MKNVKCKIMTIIIESCYFVFSILDGEAFSSNLKSGLIWVFFLGPSCCMTSYNDLINKPVKSWFKICYSGLNTL